MKPKAALSLDLDNLWSYLKVRGDKQWEYYPSYLNTLVPEILDFLDELNLKITFFIVGKDAMNPKHHEILREIVHRGHDIGNHSFHHEPWLHLLSKKELEEEILSADNAIQVATGKKPVGFRGPGFSWNTKLLEVLSENDYKYDSTIFPTFIGPIARKYFFSKSGLSKTEQHARSEMYGSFSDVLHPNKPYLWNPQKTKKMIEIPVSTIPFLKTPFHLSYLMFLAKYSERVMLFYLQTAITLCRLSRTSPNFLMHPTDLFGSDRIPEMEYFPGMDIPTSKKQEICKCVLESIQQYYDFEDMSTFADHSLKTHKKIKTRSFI